MSKIESRLLDNHLSFLASHRGSIRKDGDTFFVESDRPEFTYAILGGGSRLEDLPEGALAAQRLPWSAVTDEALQAAGFSPTVGLSYMTLGEGQPEWRVRQGLAVARVESPEQMDLFSEVQTRGFNETEESYRSWHPWLRAANHRNLGNPGHAFYVGSLGPEPVGTALVVLSGETAGIYAVATLPGHRKTGVSATIMKRAIAEALARGVRAVTLQVKQDSYAEDFYRHLGFERCFTTRMYRRIQLN